MDTLKDWAKFYRKKGIYVYPSDYSFTYDSWNTFTESIQDIDSYNWKGLKGLDGLSGKVGIRIIRIDTTNKGELYKKYAVNKILSLLSLDRYPWVIDNNDSIYIVINCPCFVSAELWSRLDGIIVMYKGLFTLPSNNGEASFYFNGIPTIKPAYIKENTLISCFKLLQEDSFLTNNQL